MTAISINAERLLRRVRDLGQIGRDRDGRLVRLAGSDAEKAGRDAFVAWVREAGLDVAIDWVGNIFGVSSDDANAGEAPVLVRSHIVELVEGSARARGLASKRMTSGAGHDAQMMARIVPSAMIFVPSLGGISHNPSERTSDADLVAGANILLDVVTRLASR
jgi:acetylornithine deacetylase/succinyl-diaminopimelate desuccinylase-like protein